MYKIHEVLTKLKNKKLKINNSLIGKYEERLENYNFEPDYYSRTAIGVYKMAHDSLRLMKWLAYYDRSYHEKISNYDLMGSFSKDLYEIF